jgi:hypothetical protein
MATSSEIVPGELTCHYFTAVVNNMGKEEAQCQGYMSEGLLSFGQAELVLLFDKKANGDMIPKEFFDRNIKETIHQYLKLVLQYAKNKLVVEDKDHTEFGSPVFAKRFAGILYCTMPLPSSVVLPVQGVRSLVAVPVLADELAVYKRCGSTRILALLGQTYRWYPTVPYCNLTRNSVVSYQEVLTNSVVAKVSQLSLPATRARMKDSNLFTLEMVKDKVHQELSNDLKQMPNDIPLCFRTYIDWIAGAHLVYNPARNGLVGISRPDGDPSVVGGSYLIVTPDDNTTNVVCNVLEDGFIVMVNNNDFEAFKRAITEGADFDLGNFRMRWITQHDWDRQAVMYKGGNENVPQKEGASLNFVNLISNQEYFEIRWNAKAISGYISEMSKFIEAYVNKRLVGVADKQETDFQVFFTALSGEKKIKLTIAVKKTLAYLNVQELEQELNTRFGDHDELKADGPELKVSLVYAIKT